MGLRVVVRLLALGVAVLGLVLVLGGLRGSSDSKDSNVTMPSYACCSIIDMT